MWLYSTVDRLRIDWCWAPITADLKVFRWHQLQERKREGKPTKNHRDQGKSRRKKFALDTVNFWHGLTMGVTGTLYKWTNVFISRLQEWTSLQDKIKGCLFSVKFRLLMKCYFKNFLQYSPVLSHKFANAHLLIFALIPISTNSKYMISYEAFSEIESGFVLNKTVWNYLNL